jgi:hypothetical protein
MEAEAPPQVDAAPSPWRRLIPWASLAWGVTSALIMNRDPGRAWLVAVAVLAGWGALIASIVVTRAPAGGRGLRIAAYSTRTLTQSLIQLTVFFVAPLYWTAYAGTVGHALTLAALVVTGGVTLWDPLFERVFARLPLTLACEAVASFTGLLAALPLLGLSHATSLTLATLGAVVGLPLVAAATGEPAARLRRVRSGVVAGALLAAAVYFGVARWVPPAPLKLAQGVMARGIERSPSGKGGEPIGAAERFDATAAAPLDKLWCFTSIHAPLGLRERFTHVWRHTPYGEAAPARETRVELPPVDGQRKGAWRTWSVRSAPAAGEWTCEVVTSTGQTLGVVEATVGSP